MSKKSYTKRIRVTPTGKLLTRKPGGNHFNSAEPRRKQLARKRGSTIVLTPKTQTRFLPGTTK